MNRKGNKESEGRKNVRAGLSRPRRLDGTASSGEHESFCLDR